MIEEKKDLINLKEIVDFKWVLTSLLEENEKLERQLKKRKRLLNKFKIQQKEFIKFLEDEIKELQKIKETELDCDILKDVIPQLLVCEEILQKYKEVIGSDK